MFRVPLRAPYASGETGFTLVLATYLSTARRWLPPVADWHHVVQYPTSCLDNTSGSQDDVVKRDRIGSA